jgi:Protein of unknown function (DUF3102)
MTNILTPARKVQITKKIKTLEKKSISNVIETGKLLKEFYDGCEHGEYTDWVKAEFSWSQRTTLNYRNVYEFSKLATIANLNITQTALYLVAGMTDDDEQAARKAVIKAARRGRVTYPMARHIIEAVRIEEHEAQLEEPPPTYPDPPADDHGEAPPSCSADEAPPDDDEDDDEQFSEIVAALQTLLDISERDKAWPKIVADTGTVGLCKISAMLLAVVDQSSESAKSTAVKSAADRAEAKAKMRLN